MPAPNDKLRIEEAVLTIECHQESEAVATLLPPYQRRRNQKAVVTRAVKAMTRFCGIGKSSSAP